MPATLEHPGIVRKAIPNGDGTYNVHDVPILPTVPKGLKGAPDDMGPDWWQKVIRFAQTESVGHLGSLSVNHHGGMDTPEYAGKILPRRIGTTVLEGEKVPCLFADFLFVPERVVTRMEANELSYRSPEIYDWDTPRIDNVSLLSTQPPQFRMPMLRVVRADKGEVVEQFSSPAEFHAAFFGAAPTQFSFAQEFPMPKPDETKKPAAAFEDDEKDDETPAEMEDGGLGVEAVVKAIESGEIMVKDFAAIKAAMDQAAGTAEPEPEPEGEEEAAPGGPVQMQADPRSAARMAALEDKVAKFEAEKRLDKRLTDAHAKFEAENIHLSDSRRKVIARFARDYRDDAEFDTAVTEYMAGLDPDPAPTFGAAVASAKNPDPPEVAKFAAQGPERLAQARALNASYDRMKGHLKVNREQFIAAHLREEG